MLKISFIRYLRRVALIAVIVLVINFAVWGAVNRAVGGPAWGGMLNFLAYSGWQAGDKDQHFSPERIESDMALLAPHTAGIRVYGLSDGLDSIVTAAKKHNLEVIAGAWVSPDAAANTQEIERLIEVTAANSNVRRVMVGNESLLRKDVTTDQLIALIEQVKRQVSVPVSTAEPWHIWLDYPDLAQAVDFITVHILPYWEGIPLNEAVPYVLYRWQQLRTAFPDKHILIGEVGWPSDGQWVQGSEPSQVNQAHFIREFLNLASRERMDYSIVESIDAPWKRGIEGTVGAHWGLWDATREPKFAMSGTVAESAGWLWNCLAASLLALPAILWFVWRRRDVRPAGQLFYALLIQAVASTLVWVVTTALADKIIDANTLSWFVLIGFQVVLLALLLADGLELAEVMWANRCRAFVPQDLPPPVNAPKVSIHVPCYNEPPHMVIETLDALAKLDWPNFEVLVVDNNTRDREVWKPLEEHCAKLGERFRFFHLPKWPGYKAGALNFALAHTAADATIIGVIDSDYTVSPDWLRATVPYFDRSQVAFVQAPQDYRDGDESLFKRMCYWEYAGFFHIGMIQRNERNAIIQHGTMTLIRRSTLQHLNGWAEWCICEDAELGLRLFEGGHEAVYLEHSFGRGLIPDNFGAYRTQRFRWAYGAVQILKRHWRQLMEGSGGLTGGQRYHFISGWLPWFADAAHMVFAAAAVLWSSLLFMRWVEFPPAVFLAPVLGVFVFKIASGLLMYHARVKCGWRDRIGAAVAGMALTHAVGRAVWQGIFTSGKPFLRTPKCADRPAAIQGLLMAREELLLLIALLASAAAVVWQFGHQNFNAMTWAGMLVVQTLPYWAALCMSMINALPGKKTAAC